MTGIWDLEESQPYLLESHTPEFSRDRKIMPTPVTGAEAVNGAVNPKGIEDRRLASGALKPLISLVTTTAYDSEREGEGRMRVWR